MNMEIVASLGFRLIKNSLSIVPLNEKTLINTISPNSYGISISDQEMHNALINADYLVLDGLYFGLLPLLLNGKIVKRITGWDCFRYFSERINEKHGKVFFLGSSDDTLVKIKNNYFKDYPNIQVDAYSPPFSDSFSDKDLRLMRERINTFSPDVLFIGMTAPKQEKWGYQNKEFLNVHIICTIGNVFDWYAGNSRRPGIFWQKTGLEWLARIFYRPEIFKRNINNQILFFWHLLLFVLKIKKHD
jgi:N-acetylglucosaminyldiphosphoundecaprenol N-acetyl-beta-D-mannosaminyltransferase